MIFTDANRNIFPPVAVQNLAKGTFLRIDYPLLLLLIVISSIGLIVMFSAAGQNMELVWRQGWRLMVGFLFFIVFASVPLEAYRRWAWLLYTVGLILLVFVLVIGEASKGAQRWLNVWLLTFQPSEILKFAVPLFLCKIFASDGNYPSSLKTVLIALLVVLLPVALVIKQPDLGTAVLIFISAAWVIFLTGISWRLILLFIALMVAAAVPIWHYWLHFYQQKRIEVFLDPQSNLTGEGYHIYQSKVAIGSGGLWGKGWFNGTQAQLGFVPEHSTDFIFAVFAEEFGFVGCCLLILLYIAVVVRGIIITLNAKDYFGHLLAGSLTFSFACYFFINIAMVSGLLPVVGVPLPLMSYGGSSIVVVLASFGILVSVFRHRPMLSQRL
ncbi:MAG: rod shape-determining protein RodA [Chromatiales bacterium]|nr:rod shape-determining protein RodA [Chromatiales bacterium]